MLGFGGEWGRSGRRYPAPRPFLGDATRQTPSRLPPQREGGPAGGRRSLRHLGADGRGRHSFQIAVRAFRVGVQLPRTGNQLPLTEVNYHSRLGLLLPGDGSTTTHAGTCAAW
jgi:hypothetical protein